ncbi:glycosyltransferase family 2 protein [Cronbergia sp. UHCC 0137]|uniref:glycosyltransferase family 2 protein n=1 Tax=Cronbergia sp. UHCC 0137 TaxID=3110239 RepID=UPI002B2190E1|nr:glycosyltransferase family 2 protein [Cronbergia sp. UHCC 0137]MEA5620794.1 glycosyltransferase family 2 protein [Cronbergia sp. UHCC 0137]
MTYLSIITPLFNKGNYISETISSVQSQIMTDWEMIIIDNGSTDNSPLIADQYAQEDTRIRFMEFKDKQGPCSVRNMGLGFATGDWVLFLDADDLITPDFLINRYKLSNTNAQIIVGKWQEFEDNGIKKALERQPTGWKGDTFEVLESAIAYAPWALHSAIIRRNWLIKERQWHEELNQVASEDTAFWFRVLQDAKIAWCDHAGALYRVKTSNSRNQIRDPQKWIYSVSIVIKTNLTYLEKLGIKPTPSQYENVFRVLESLYRLAWKSKLYSEKNNLQQQIYEFMDITPLNLGIVVRKLIGLELFNLIRYGMK